LWQKPCPIKPQAKYPYVLGNRTCGDFWLFRKEEVRYETN